MKTYHAVLLGRNRYFRAEIDFEVDEATPGDIGDIADEEADSYALLLMGKIGIIDIDSVHEMA